MSTAHTILLSLAAKAAMINTEFVAAVAADKFEYSVLSC
jgi:hypothetical protein